MKLQIDFDNKIIKLESNVNLKEFFEKIEAAIPDWKEYRLDCNTVINWNYYPSYIYPSRNTWYNRPWYNTVTGSQLTITNDSGRLTNSNINVSEKPNTIVNFEL